ncbi:acyl-Coenzyme A oxidase [Apophysomyces sp. BC1021]|nr:acyl-Coenzyme A oxidase [Apophysomyces sp. BC1021]
MTTFPKNPVDASAKAAAVRLEQIKQQLNLTPSSMSLQAPKDMAAERASADFDIGALAHFWAGGKYQHELRQKAYNMIQHDPAFVVQPPRNLLDMPRDEMKEFTMGQIHRLSQMIDDPTFRQDKELLDSIPDALRVYSPSYSMRSGVHSTLFRNVIQMLGSKEQQKQWIDEIDNFRVIGCFAMTELGHSSALRDIETTATYDRASDEFVINSPTITSTKWWIGMAGQTATHTVVICQTIIDGKRVGHNWFVVPLRRKASGELMPNVMAGDVGQKAGHNGLDNGWIQFREARVPRSNMLSGWVSLDPQGEYTAAPSPAVMYATLIPERLSLVYSTILLIPQAITIATRYGVVRRQGPKNEQIMDYQSHYGKLLPAIAFMYLVRSSLNTLNDQFAILTAGGEMDPMVYMNHMGDMHAISACFKGLSGNYSSQILEDTRRSCGGHAYSAYNAIAGIIGDWGVMTTGGGDNVVLLQQTARFLLDQLSKRLDGDAFPQLKYQSSTHYLLRAKEYLQTSSWRVTNMADCVNDLRLIEDAIHSVLVKRLYAIHQALQSGGSYDDHLLDCTRAAELHCAAFIFSDNVAKLSSSAFEASTVSIMRRLTVLWGFHVLHTWCDEGFKEGFFDPNQIKAIRKAYLDQCKGLRKQAIGLTDAWSLPDFVLKAPIAKYDGDIYQRKTRKPAKVISPTSMGIPKYHDQHIRPLTERVSPK